MPFDDWVAQCREIDILLTSTASDAPLLTSEILAPMLRQRLDRSLFIIDIAVPRDVDPSVNELQGVYLYDIDSIRSVAEQSLELRLQQVAAAEAIIADHVTEFVDSISRGLNRASRATEHSPWAKIRSALPSCRQLTASPAKYRALHSRDDCQDHPRHTRQPSCARTNPPG